MKQSNVQTIPRTALLAERDRVFEAVYDLVTRGHANLHPISGNDYWLRLKTGEAFMMTDRGISRVV
jgi:hypothetical protein